MSAALVLVGTMGGADEEVLPLFKIAGGGVVELLLTVVAEYQAGEHIALPRRCSAMPLLPDLLHLCQQVQLLTTPAFDIGTDKNTHSTSAPVKKSVTAQQSLYAEEPCRQSVGRVLP